RLYALCRRMMGSPADAADATQEALIAIVKGLPRFDLRASFTTWSYRVATNACLDELRRRARRPALGLDDTASFEHIPRDGAPGVAEAVTDQVAVERALAGLAIEFRSAVVLRDVCGR